MTSSEKNTTQQNTVPEYMIWKPSDAQLLVLKKKGIVQDWSDLDNDQLYSLRDVARKADMSEAWVRRLLASGKITSTKDKRKRYQVTASEVARVRFEFAQKHLGIAKREAEGKKYTNKAPREWAFDMVTKAISEDKQLSQEQKAQFMGAMERYNKVWEARYNKRKAKIKANKAKKK